MSTSIVTVVFIATTVPIPIRLALVIATAATDILHRAIAECSIPMSTAIHGRSNGTHTAVVSMADATQTVQIERAIPTPVCIVLGIGT